jgi:uncharacterized protein with HEPN domain
LGEVAHKISGETEAAWPGIPFKSLRGMRNRMAHDDGAVDFRIVSAEPSRSIIEGGLRGAGFAPAVPPTAG